MKKALILSSLLLALSLNACSLSNNNQNKSRSSEGSNNEYSEEDRYFGYPDDPNGYNLPKHAVYDVYFESDANSNGSHDVHTYYDYHVIINNDEIYAHAEPEDEKHHTQFYMKGRYVAGTGDMSFMHTWMYDVYMQPLGEDDIALAGPEWRYLISGQVSLALTYSGRKEFFDYSNVKGSGARKTGNSRIIDGEECDEYDLTYWGGNYFYYSKKDDVIKGYRLGGDVDYQYYYILNYSLEEVEIPFKPGDNILIA